MSRVPACHSCWEKVLFGMWHCCACTDCCPKDARESQGAEKLHVMQCQIDQGKAILWGLREINRRNGVTAEQLRQVQLQDCEERQILP